MAKTWAAPFPQVPDLGSPGVRLTTAMATTTAWDGTTAVGTAMALIDTVSATDGAWLDSIRAKITSTAGGAPSGTTNDNIVRVWANNGSANTTATNNIHLGDIAIPQLDVNTMISTNAPSQEYRLDRFHPVPAGYRIYAGLVNAVGGTNCAVHVYAVMAQYS